MAAVAIRANWRDKREKKVERPHLDNLIIFHWGEANREAGLSFLLNTNYTN
jgi:hypothetical protein